MFFLTSSYKVDPDPIVILKGGVVIPLIFPKLPQSSQTESLYGFPSYPLPLNTPGPLRTL